jgi:KaiC/GvpD/RAD55 family RecA-like ATPase
LITDKYTIINPADLNEFNIKIFKAINELQDKNLKRCCIDALSTLFVYIPPDLALKFVSSLFAKLKAIKITSLITIEKDVLDPKTVAVLESLTDGMVELNYDPIKMTQRLIRVDRMKDTKHPLTWMKFGIGDNGIMVV